MEDIKLKEFKERVGYTLDNNKEPNILISKINGRYVGKKNPNYNKNR